MGIADAPAFFQRSLAASAGSAFDSNQVVSISTNIVQDFGNFFFGFSV